MLVLKEALKRNNVTLTNKLTKYVSMRDTVPRAL